MNEEFQANFAKLEKSVHSSQEKDQPRILVNKDSSLSSDQSQLLLKSAQSQLSDSARLAVSSNPNQLNDGIGKGSSSSQGRVASNEQKIENRLLQSRGNSPSRRSLNQSPSFGCLVKKQLSKNPLSPQRTPHLLSPSDSFNAQRNVFFNGNIVLPPQSNSIPESSKVNLNQQEQIKYGQGSASNDPRRSFRSVEAKFQSKKESSNQEFQSQKSRQSNQLDQSQVKEEEVKRKQSSVYFSEKSSGRSNNPQQQNPSIGSQRNQGQNWEQPGQFAGQFNQNYIAPSSAPQLAQQIGIAVGNITTYNLNNVRIVQPEQQIHQYSVPVPIVSFQQQPIVQNIPFPYGNVSGRIIEQYVQMQSAEIFSPSQPQAHLQYIVVPQNPIQQNPIQNFQQPNNNINIQIDQSLHNESLVGAQYSQSEVNMPVNLSHAMIPQSSQQASVQNASDSSYMSYQNRGSVSSYQAVANFHVSAQSNNPSIESHNREQLPQLVEPNNRAQGAGQNQPRILSQFQIPNLNNLVEEESYSDNQLSDQSSIPSEHEEGLNFNEYTRRYALKIVTITWFRDSHGLFDFEMRQLKREQFLITDESNFFRKEQKCEAIRTDVNLREKFDKKAQLLMTIKKHRNRYLLVSPVGYLLKHAQSPEEIKRIQETDVENFYSEMGEQLLPPYDMCERMYLVVKSIINDRNVHQDYELKKGDVIKVGRAKFLVRDINIKNKNKKMKQKKEKIARLRRGYVEKVARERRSASANADQHERSQMNGTVTDLEYIRQPLHRQQLITGESSRARNRTVAEEPLIQAEISINELSERQLDRQRERSVGGVTQITADCMNQEEERKEPLEDEIEFPKNLQLADQSNSSDESDWLGGYQDDEGQQEESQFKKIIKRYAQIDMAPLEQEIKQREEPNQSNDIKIQASQEIPKEQQALESSSVNNLIKSKQSDKKEQLAQPVQSQQADVAGGLDSSQAFCRFCWANENDNTNPLISSCNCSGGVRYVHYECLKTWVKTKMNVKEDLPKLKIYMWRTLQCEICRTAFPTRFKTQNGLKYSLFDFKIDKEKDYMMLEAINPDSKSPGKLIYFLYPDNENCSFKLGRANDQDVRVNDISASRQHATIIFQDDKFKIKDNLSKFGTLIQIRTQLEIKPNQTRIIQVGRTLMNVSLQPLKQKKPHNSQILWQDTKQPPNSNLNGLAQQVYNKQNKDSNKNVMDMCSRIKNTDQYIRQQSFLHRRMLHNIIFDHYNLGAALGYNIERRQLNQNLDDFCKNLANDEVSSESDEEVKVASVRRPEEESKSFGGVSRLNQFEERKGEISQIDRRINNQPQRPGPQQRVIPQRRVFIEADSSDNNQQQRQQFRQQQPQRPNQDLNNSRLQLSNNYSRSDSD